MTKIIHSYWAYLVLIILIAAVVNAVIGLAGKKEFKAKDLRISLFALIIAHIQLIFGSRMAIAAWVICPASYSCSNSLGFVVF